MKKFTFKMLQKAVAEAVKKGLSDDIILYTKRIELSPRELWQGKKSKRKKGK